MSIFNRWAMMTGAGTAAGALIVATAGAALEIDEARADQPTPLAELLAAHAACKAAEADACVQLSKAQDRFDATPASLAPRAVLPNGECKGAHFDCRVISEECIRKEIRNAHRSYMDRYCNPWARAMFPGREAETRAAIAKSQRRAMRRLTSILRAEKQLEDAVGLTAAFAAYDDAVTAETRAALAIHAYRPVTAQEQAAKAEWLHNEGRRKNYHFSVEELDALFSSLGERA